MDNLKSNQQRRGSLMSLSSPQTLWSSEKSSRDSRSIDERGVNVQVILRCRPLSEEEVKVKTPVVISCNELKQEVTVIQNTAHKQIDRTFTFDKVFSPASKQKDLYDQAVAPIVNEALEGYNCTIFAYGQTGTGKTYTMEGKRNKEKNGEFHKDAGVIPRAVEQIFNILEAQNTEYAMKVTFLELYNEEITDLLAPDDSTKFSGEKLKKPITLMEDGKGAVYVRGIEEQIVCTADEIYKIVEKGSAKKHTADTLLNKQSNRSHSIFSITVHVKECTSDEVELIKCGKLNLVDLAGSENILRSGAREERAREAGEINKSLLTLGRVINALVEQSGHVPYRDSKLTRLLGDSLGGKTKTCIIATISPSVHCLEESLSTLDYAYRAKNIKNRPEVNQKVIKSALIKDLYMEINRLKQELDATREKNGIYIPRDHHHSEEACKKAMAEKLGCMESDLEFKDKQLMELQELYLYQQRITTDLSKKLNRTKRELEKTEQDFLDVEDRYAQTNETSKEKEYLILNLLGSEKALTERATELRNELENAASDVSSLSAKIEYKNNMECRNKNLFQKFHAQLTQQLEVCHRAIAASVTQQQQQLKGIEESSQSFVFARAAATEELQTKLRKLKDMYGSGIDSLDNLAGELERNSQFTFGKMTSEISKHSSSFVELIRQISSETTLILNDLESSLNNQEERVAAFAQEQHESHSRTYQTTQSISKVTMNFFKTLSMYASKLTLMVEEAQTINQQQLCDLVKKIEEHIANEEKQLVALVSELLASSNATKKRLVQTAVDDLCESAASRTSQLHQEMSNMQDITSSAQEEWMTYVGKSETNYVENTKTAVSGKNCIEENLRQCMKKAGTVANHWRKAHESLLDIQRRNMENMHQIIQEGGESNQTVHAQISSIVSSTCDEADIVKDNSLSSIECLLKLGCDACEKINSLIGPSCENMRKMESDHSQKIVEIIGNAEKCLANEYVVDEPLCSTPRKEPINIPSIKSIEELRTPPFEELLKLFKRTGPVKQENGNVHESPEVHDSVQFIDSKFSLAAIS